MGKEKPGAFTPKAISNRIKSKGLQKLKWYCQVCQKQCRDENGFKCHISSEAHQRQMLLFGSNADQFIADYSRQFLSAYLDILRRQFGGKRTHANVIYQEYIKDKNHVHMNSTRWHSLTGLSLFLDQKGICKSEQTESGWYLEYIDKDPIRDAKRKADEKLELTEEEANQRMLERQIERDRERQSDRNKDVAVPSVLTRMNEEEKVKIQISSQPILKAVTSSISKTSSNPLRTSEIQSSSSLSGSIKRSRKENNSLNYETVLLDLIKEQEHEKEIKNRRNNWFHHGIIVKIIDKDSEFKNRKGLVSNLLDAFNAELTLLPDLKTTTQVNQRDVATVIPALGSSLLVVNGAYRGCHAKLLEVDIKRATASIEIENGNCKGFKKKDISVDDISKLYNLNK